MDDDTIGIVLIVVGAAVLICGLIVGKRRSASRPVPAEEPFVDEASYDRRDEVEQNLSNLRRTRGEIDI